MLSTLYPEKGSVWTFILLYINLIDTKTFVHIHFLLHQQKLVTFAWYKTHMIMNQIFRMSLYLLMVVLWMASCHNPLRDADRDALYAQLKRADSCSRHKQEEQAILYYFEWLEQAKGQVSALSIADVYDKIGTLYLYRNLYIDAIGMFRQSAVIYREVGDWKEEAMAWRNIGRANLMRHRSDSIIFYYQRAIGLAEETGEHELLKELQREYQFVCSKNALLQENSRLWLHYLDMLDSTEASNLLYGSIIADQANGYQEAEEWLLKAANSEDIFIRTNAYRKLYDWSKRIEDSNKTARYSDLYIQWADSLEKEHSSSLSLHNLGQSYEKQRMEVENERLKNQQLKRTMYLLCMIAGLCLLLLIGVFLYQKEKQKRERELANLMQQIREKEYLIENLQTSQQKPSVPLRYEAFDLLYRLKTDPRYGLVQTEDEWLQLYAVINRLYGDIVDKLRNWPQLTEQDVRVCYLVHARMSNANLGALFNVDSRSITKSKQRIKKKMEIDGEWSLEEYLMKGK